MKPATLVVMNVVDGLRLNFIAIFVFQARNTIPFAQRETGSSTSSFFHDGGHTCHIFTKPLIFIRTRFAVMAPVSDKSIILPRGTRNKLVQYRRPLPFFGQPGRNGKVESLRQVLGIPVPGHG